MIIAKTNGQTYSLRWLGQEWRDKAGHVWRMGKDGHFVSKEHGPVHFNQWNIFTEENNGFRQRRND